MWLWFDCTPHCRLRLIHSVWDYCDSLQCKYSSNKGFVVDRISHVLQSYDAKNDCCFAFNMQQPLHALACFTLEGDTTRHGEESHFLWSRLGVSLPTVTLIITYRRQAGDIIPVLRHNPWCRIDAIYIHPFICRLSIITFPSVDCGGIEPMWDGGICFLGLVFILVAKQNKHEIFTAVCSLLACGLRIAVALAPICPTHLKIWPKRQQTCVALWVTFRHVLTRIKSV